MDADAWLKNDPYLQPIARLCAEVESAAAEVVVARASVPSWEEYATDFSGGVPLLSSFDAAVDLEPAGDSTLRLVGKLAETSTDKLSAELRALDAELRRERDVAQRLPAWLLGDNAFTPPSPGVLRFIGWTAMRRYLAPLLAAFDRWRTEDRWLRSFCPTCGSHPAMAQLIGIDPGRMRFLVCGH